MIGASFDPVAPDADVFGVCRPGHFGQDLEEWIGTLEAAGVERVVCLLSKSEAIRWGLPDAYADRFEATHAPIRDRHLPDEATLAEALAAVRRAETADRGVTLHCNAGLGRTGIVAAAWLTRHHGYDPEAAVATVEAAGRAPREAVRCDNATEAELHELLTG
jgi:atypical dual specificity phosphatase